MVEDWGSVMMGESEKTEREGIYLCTSPKNDSSDLEVCAIE